ncbi:MAG: MIP/aquaporin family protein [Bacteroidota bacterium]|nr:MIP/aquaporin family protein [Bacteroidota bacterium]MDP4212959.1 MIP/aquaporin family protein [Bacteroidota bacterium]MDP4250781.1 MIP/aquaporin family protein [Bacteroidota bacterium]
MSPFMAEYVGTLLLLLLGNGVVANVVLTDTKGQNSGWIVICTGWGLAVFVAVVVAGPFSGAHLNPAVTLALAIGGKFSWASVLPYVLAQMLGAMSGSFLVWLMYRDHYNRTKDPGLQQASFCTSPAIYNPIANLFSEIVGTFVLTYTIFYITGAEITSSKTLIGLGSVGAIPAGLLVWVIGLSLGGSTGYAINPARDLGPRIMHALLPMKGKGESNWSYAWIPVLGPLLGGVLGALVYVVLR